jgi:DNA-binding transcriptional ArsR family regulator
MRTYGLVILLSLAVIASAGSAAALPQDVEAKLAELGLGVPTPKGGSGHDDLRVDQPQVAAPNVHPDRSLAALISIPTAAVANTLMLLGLQLVGGLFHGFDQGGAMVAQAAKTVVSRPAPSLSIASMGLAIAGLVSGLGYLAQRYGGLGGIPLYTRIAKSQLLENGVRQQIMDLITQNPGINVSEISRRLDIAWGTATHHLQKLRHEKLVNIRVASNQKCFFPNGGTYTPHEMDVMSATKSPTARQIAEFLVKNGPQCHREITEALGLTPALVSFHATKLVQSGVVARHRDGRRTIFTPLEATLDPAPRAVLPH